MPLLVLIGSKDYIQIDKLHEVAHVLTLNHAHTVIIHNDVWISDENRLLHLSNSKEEVRRNKAILFQLSLERPDLLRLRRKTGMDAWQREVERYHGVRRSKAGEGECRVHV
jgi:hypothetical protein